MINIPALNLSSSRSDDEESYIQIEGKLFCDIVKECDEIAPQDTPMEKENMREELSFKYYLIEVSKCNMCEKRDNKGKIVISDERTTKKSQLHKECAIDLIKQSPLEEYFISIRL
jgi:hypothetical protein